MRHGETGKGSDEPRMMSRFSLHNQLISPELGQATTGAPELVILEMLPLLLETSFAIISLRGLLPDCSELSAMLGGRTDVGWH